MNNSMFNGSFYPIYAKIERDLQRIQPSFKAFIEEFIKDELAVDFFTQQDHDEYLALNQGILESSVYICFVILLGSYTNLGIDKMDIL
ncbi:MAG TPA: hypothetical protein VGA67_05825 [Candidatus Dojkabacteria bacterium]